MAKFISSLELTAEEALQINYDACELAKRRGISLRQLERTFLAQFGRSPQEWLDEQKILAARQLLLGGESVKNAALVLGFKQPSHFSRVFKARTGICPSQLSRGSASSADCSLGGDYQI